MRLRDGEVSVLKLAIGAMLIMAFAAGALVVLPYFTMRGVPAPEGLVAYNEAQLRGRQSYIANGCIYCHSQQPRDPSVAPDMARGWGRPSVPADYVYDKPHLLGTMRTGPDLFNIAVRQPSRDWHLGHLYQPRAYSPGSIMPAYPFLFERKQGASVAGEVTVTLPPAYAREGERIVATQEALDLVEYLLSLNRSYPVVATPTAP